MKYNFKGISEGQNIKKVNIVLPSIVTGVLIALKHIGMTSMSYWAIIWFGVEIWLCCVALVLVVLLIGMVIKVIFESFNKI